MIRIFIVDDEQDIREDLISLLSKNKDYIIVGSSGTVKEANLLIPKAQPDVLLLDVQLRDGTGFDLLSSLGQLNFHIIFISGFNQFAIQAFKYGALDYLLKPIDRAELSAALDKARSMQLREELLRSSLSIAKTHYSFPDQAGWDRIALPSRSTLEIVPFDDILYCRGNEGYTYFYLTNNREVVVSKHLKEYEQLLPAVRFVRCHQSYLVNGFYIQRYHNEGYLVLQGGLEIPVSRPKKQRVISFLNGNQIPPQ